MKKADSKASEKTAGARRPPGAKEPQGGAHNPLLLLQGAIGNRLLSEVLDGKVQCDFWDDIWGGGGNGYNETSGEVGYDQTGGSAGWNPEGGEAGYSETSGGTGGASGQVPATAGFNYGYEPYEVGGGGNGYNESGEVGYDQTGGAAGWNPEGGEAGYSETNGEVGGGSGQVPATAGFSYGYEPYEVGGGGGVGGEIGDGGLGGEPPMPDQGRLWDKGTDKLKKGAAKKWDSAKEWGDLIFDPEKSAGEKLEEGAEKAWGNVKGKAARVGETAEKAWDYGTKGAEQLWETGEKGAEKAWDYGTKGAEQVWDTSKEVASGVGSAVEGGVEWAGEKAGQVASGVGEAAGSAWDWATGGGGGGGGEEDWWQMKPEGLQRQGPEEEELMQGKEGAGQAGVGNVGAQVMGMIDARRGGGQALDAGLRAKAEASLGLSLADVRLHTGSEADELAAGLKARAFTTGKDVFFRAKDFDPHSPSGQELIGHELTHVLQQHQGLSEPAGRPGDRYEQEADRVGAAMFKGEAAPVTGAVQAQAEEEEEVQAKPDAAVQRQAASDGGGGDE